MRATLFPSPCIPPSILDTPLTLHFRPKHVFPTLHGISYWRPRLTQNDPRDPQTRTLATSPRGDNKRVTKERMLRREREKTRAKCWAVRRRVWRKGGPAEGGERRCPGDKKKHTHSKKKNIQKHKNTHKHTRRTQRARKKPPETQRAKMADRCTTDANWSASHWLASQRIDLGGLRGVEGFEGWGAERVGGAEGVEGRRVDIMLQIKQLQPRTCPS